MSGPFRCLRRALVSVAAGVTLSCAASWASAQDCKPPRILFVLDASSSMRIALDDGSIKWDVVQTAVSAALAEHADAAQFGLMTFPGSAGGCATGDVVVDVGVDTAASINSTLGNLVIPDDNQTPAGQSLVEAASYAPIVAPDEPTFVIFMTDGWQYCSHDSAGPPVCASATDCDLMGLSGACPTCNSCQQNDSDPACSGQLGDGCFCTRSWPVLGVEELAAAGTPTYVVGFGSATDIGTLNRAADAGGTALAGCDPDSSEPSCYLQATDASELVDALTQIVADVVTAECSGQCGIAGQRTCTAAGWSECDAPDTVSCETPCGTGTQTCVEGELSACEPACGGAGGGGGAPATSGGGAPIASAGQPPGAGQPTLSPTDPPEVEPAEPFFEDSDDRSSDEGGCGCRAPAREVPVWGGLLSALGLLLVAARRKNPSTRAGVPRLR